MIHSYKFTWIGSCIPILQMTGEMIQSAFHLSIFLYFTKKI